MVIIHCSLSLLWLIRAISGSPGIRVEKRSGVFSVINTVSVLLRIERRRESSRWYLPKLHIWAPALRGQGIHIHISIKKKTHLSSTGQGQPVLDNTYTLYVVFLWGVKSFTKGNISSHGSWVKHFLETIFGEAGKSQICPYFIIFLNISLVPQLIITRRERTSFSS